MSYVAIIELKDDVRISDLSQFSHRFPDGFMVIFGENRVGSEHDVLNIQFEEPVSICGIEVRFLSTKFILVRRQNEEDLLKDYKKVVKQLEKWHNEVVCVTFMEEK